MSNKAKLITAIILILIMIPTMGVMVVKDSLHSVSYCSSCHEDPYYSEWKDPEADHSLAHQHALNGITCEGCHNRTLGDSLTEVVNYVTGNYYYPLPKAEFSMEACFTCHESYAAIIPPLEPAVTGEERNPHNGHWGELECSECHNMHRNSYDYCAQCHFPVTDSPGWVTSKDLITP